MNTQYETLCDDEMTALVTEIVKTHTLDRIENKEVCDEVCAYWEVVSFIRANGL